VVVHLQIITAVANLCGLVVRVPAYGSRGPGLILGATRFSEKYWVWNGVHSVLSTIEERLWSGSVAALV
jgi:hypothetical protein